MSHAVCCEVRERGARAGGGAGETAGVPPPIRQAHVEVDVVDVDNDDDGDDGDDGDNGDNGDGNVESPLFVFEFVFFF